MKIGVDIRTLMDKRYSGVSEYTYNLLKEIIRQDEKNEFLLFYNSFGDCPNIPDFQAKKVKIVRYNYPNKVLNYLFFKFFNSPKINQELGVDVFFMPHINFIGMSAGARSLITVHDLSFLRYPEFFSRRKNFWHNMIGVRKLLKKFSQIAAVSENTKRDIVELCGINPSKVKVIYSGVSEKYRKISSDQLPTVKQILKYNGLTEAEADKGKHFKAPMPYLNADGLRLKAVKNKYNLPDEFILYLGTVEPRKNLEGIIRAYNELVNSNSELRSIKLVIAGGQGWKCKPAYREWQRSAYKNDIKFLGYIEDSDKAQLYNLASVFIYPSFHEGFGFPPLEAMASGLPVVCGFSPSLSEISGSGAIMVDPYNTSEIAAGLKEVLIDGALRKKLIEQGQAWAKNFNWRKTAQKYLEIFQKININ